MPKAEVFNLQHEKVGDIELNAEVFGAEVNRALLYEAVRHHLAGLRRGTHATKTRDRVAGSGKKLWKQKGTGRARVGSVRSPIWRHGGTVHGPQPRDYSYGLNKKMILGALRSALSDKLNEKAITVVEAFKLDSPKTKSFNTTLKKKYNKGSVLLVDTGINRNLELSARNLANVEYRTSRELTTYDVMLFDNVVISRQALENLQEALAK